MLCHFSVDRCDVESLVESLAATTTMSESLREARSESVSCVADDDARVLPSAMLCITNVREHTMIPPNANHLKPEFLIHQSVQVQWGIADSLAAVTLGLTQQINAC